MMNDMLWLMKKTGMTTFRNFWNWMLYAALPVAAIVLAMLTQGGSGGEELRLGIVNLDEGERVTTDVIAFIEEPNTANVSEVDASEVDSLISAGDLDAALVFPEGFADSVRSGTPEPVQLLSIRGAEIAGHITFALNQHIADIAAIGGASQGDEARFNAMVEQYRQAEFRLSAETVDDRSVDHRQSRQAIGYLLVIMLFAASTLAGIMLKERENRTYHRIISSPVSPGTYIASNIALNMLIMLGQIAVTLIVMVEVLGIQTGIPFWTLFLILALFALVAVSVSLVLVVFADSSLTANSLQSALFLPASFIAGCMIPLEVMPDIMQRIAAFLPQYWLLETVGKLQSGAALSGLYVNLLILLAFTAAFTLIATYKVGRNNDTGKFV